MAKVQLNAAKTSAEVIFAVHRIELIRGILRELELEQWPPEGVAENFETYKANLCQDGLPNFLEGAFRRYEKVLRERGLVDLQDLIAMAVEGMRAGTVKPLAVAHLQVDEAQDLDRNQWELIDLHARSGVLITAVGDDDQSIYGFRSARGYNGLLEFRERYNAKTLFLGTSYRCPKAILGPAARLVKVNENRFDKVLISASNDYAHVDVVPTESSEEEVAWIADDLLKYSQKGSCAILARFNISLDFVEVALTARDIPYTRVESTSIWEHEGPALLLAFLDGLDKDSIDGAEPLLLKSGCSLQTTSAWRMRCNSPTAALHQFSHLDGIKAGKSNKVVRAIQQGIRSCYEKLGENDLSEVLDIAADLVKQVTPLYGHRVIDLCCKAIARLHGSLAERVRFLQRKKERKVDNVQLMSVHAAKGLEFDYVFLTGCHQEKPIERSLPDSEIEEERRIWYVALTRARKMVQISRSRRPVGYSSLFLPEMGFMQQR
jgi:superfamily I DNA/RNA helicase